MRLAGECIELGDQAVEEFPIELGMRMGIGRPTAMEMERGKSLVATDLLSAVVAETPQLQSKT